MKDKINWKTAVVDGVDARDYPKFCDAFIAYAEYKDGTILTETELEQLTNDYPDLVNELAYFSLF